MPLPTPVAVNVTPTVFADAPMAMKFVVPTTSILYVTPTLKLPAMYSGMNAYGEVAMLYMLESTCSV